MVSTITINGILTMTILNLILDKLLVLFFPSSFTLALGPGKIEKKGNFSMRQPTTLELSPVIAFDHLSNSTYHWNPAFSSSAMRSGVMAEGLLSQYNLY